MPSKSEKRKYLNMAKQLGYEEIMPDVFDRIKAAETETELDRIMITCRKRWEY